MHYIKFFVVILQFGLIAAGLSCGTSSVDKKIFADFIVDSGSANVEFFWKDENDEIFKSIQNLESYAKRNGKRLRFAMNGGMYMEDQKPLGLFIQNGKQVIGLNTSRAEGNFYLKPNGVFFITDNKRAFVARTENFRNDGHIKFATQSGPLLVADGEINSVFKQNSENLYLRNGVCVLEDNRIVFSISREKVNFYDFAAHFKNLGCQNALYLDGYVSKMYLPEAGIVDSGGEFGVIIGIIE
jgi:uncharacterized protein YigE (DUF2233 family)